jgi:hypothetical protein
VILPQNVGGVQELLDKYGEDVLKRYPILREQHNMSAATVGLGLPNLSTAHLTPSGRRRCGKPPNIVLLGGEGVSYSQSGPRGLACLHESGLPEYDIECMASSALVSGAVAQWRERNTGNIPLF